MIFQHFNLMDSRNVFDNVDFSLKYAGISKQERRQKVTELLSLVGLEEKARSFPSQLSGDKAASRHRTSISQRPRDLALR